MVSKRGVLRRPSHAIGAQISIDVLSLFHSLAPRALYSLSRSQATYQCSNIPEAETSDWVIGVSKHTRVNVGYSATLLERCWVNLMADIGPRQCFGWAKEELSGMAREDGEAGGGRTGDRGGSNCKGE